MSGNPEILDPGRDDETATVAPGSDSPVVDFTSNLSNAAQELLADLPAAMVERLRQFPLTDEQVEVLHDWATGPSRREQLIDEFGEETARTLVPSAFEDDEEGGGGTGTSQQDALTPEVRERLSTTKRPWRSPESEEAPFTRFKEKPVREQVIGMQPAERARLQEQLVRAGALTGDFDYGGFDPATERAVFSLMDFANAHEIGDFEEAAGEMQQARLWAEDQGVPWPDIHPGARREGGADAQSQRFQQPVYEKPDPARLRRDVREMFQGTVGRDPSDEELDRFVNMLSEADRKSFESETEKSEMEFEAAQQEQQRVQATPEEMTTAEQILEGSTMGSHPTEPARFSSEALERRTATPEAATAGAEGGRIGGGEVQSVDRMARFEEALNEHLRGEREGQEQADERRTGTQLASRAFSRIGSAMRGS